MIRIALLLALAAFPAADAASASPAAEFIADGHGFVDIDAHGRVEAVTLEVDHGAQLQAVVVVKMQRWRFEPVTHNSEPVPVRGHMRYLLQASPVAGSESLQVRIADVDFIDPPEQAEMARQMEREMRAPAYPREMISRRLGARVELAVELDAEGKVLRTAPTKGWLVGRQVEQSKREKYMAQFVEAASQAVSNWRFDPPVAGEELVIAPISFAPSESSLPATTSSWVPAVAIAFPVEPWMQERPGPGIVLSTDGSRQRRDLKLLTPIDG